MKVNKLIKLESCFHSGIQGISFVNGWDTVAVSFLDRYTCERVDPFQQNVVVGINNSKKQPFPHIIPTTIIMTAISQKRMAMFGVYQNLYRKKSFFLIIDVGGLDIWREICVYICVTTVNIDIKMYTAYIYMVEKRCIYLCSMTQQHW